MTTTAQPQSVLYIDCPNCAATGPRKTAQARLRPDVSGSYSIVDNKAACPQCKATFKVTLLPTAYLAIV
jgi:hypothetical protein